MELLPRKAWECFAQEIPVTWAIGRTEFIVAKYSASQSEKPSWRTGRVPRSVTAKMSGDTLVITRHATEF